MCSYTHLINPKLSHNDVVNGGGDLSPHIVVSTGVEMQVDGTYRHTETREEKSNIPTADLEMMQYCLVL